MSGCVLVALWAGWVGVARGKEGEKGRGGNRDPKLRRTPLRGGLPHAAVISSPTPSGACVPGVMAVGT